MPTLLTIILCGVIVPNCTEHTALKAIPVPMEFATMKDCVMGGQLFLAEGMPGIGLIPGQVGKMVCADHWIRLPPREEL